MLSSNTSQFGETMMEEDQFFYGKANLKRTLIRVNESVLGIFSKAISNRFRTIIKNCYDDLK